jgi:glutathione S-transferase
VKLYDSMGPNPAVVRMVIAEKHLAIDVEAVDIVKGENRQPGHMARNPTGGTPALQTDDGTHLTEIIAIAEYLEELHPLPALIGETPAQRAITRMWARRIDLAIAEPLTNGFRACEGRRMFEPRMLLPSMAAGSELKAMAAERLRWLDGQMAGNTWICGDRFSLADVVLFAFLRFGAQVGQPVPADLVWVNDFMARTAARASAAA